MPCTNRLLEFHWYIPALQPRQARESLKYSRQNLLYKAFYHLVLRFFTGISVSCRRVGGAEVAGARVRTLLETIKVNLNCPNWFPQRGAMTEIQCRKEDKIEGSFMVNKETQV